jgi:localization factor PodJL
MRAELPWNVAGIPPEAREAARAAARREGLSVGEWLTRHIMRSFSGSDEEGASREPQGAPPSGGWDLPPHDDGPRDESESAARTEQAADQPGEAWRRIEDQLRGIGRRLDSNERSHGESNRFLSRTAQEMNANAREQTQAFEQLGLTVHGLRERLERLERSAPGDNIRQAIKALHMGLSKLADQLTATAGNSAGQIAQVTVNLERLAVHVGKIWEDTDTTSRLLNQRMELAETELTQRLQASEQGLGSRLSAAEKATKFNSNALDHALERIETAAGERAAELAESQRRAIQHEQNIRELKESLSDLEARLPGVRLEARFNAIERSLGGLKEAIVQHDPVIVFGSAVQGLSQRLEKLEGEQAALTGWEKPVPETPENIVHEAEPVAAMAEEPPTEILPAEAPQAGFLAEPQTVTPQTHEPERPALDEEAPVAEPPALQPFAAEFDAIFPQRPDAEDTDLYFAPRESSFNPQPEALEDEADITFHDVLVEETPEDLLAQARLSAQAALDRAENERMAHDAHFHARQSLAGVEGRPRPRYLIPVAAVLLLAIVATAALVMSERAKRLGEQLAANPMADRLPALPSLPAGAQPPAPPPQALAESQAAGADNDQTAEISRTPRSTLQAPPMPDQNPAPAPKRMATMAGDRVIQQAGAGNPVALAILGLKALDGTGGTAVNLPDAVKLLTQAADKGQAFAQYRLGTLYERGQGVAADPAKAMHWYELAANQGNRKAMHNLAVAYASSPTARRNMTEAARWFAKAAALGLGDSQFNLAVLYERGEGVSQSLADAYKWYGIAALSGDAEAKSRMGVIENQLSDADKAAANKSAAAFRAAPLNRSANVPPEPADLGG